MKFDADYVGSLRELSLHCSTHASGDLTPISNYIQELIQAFMAAECCEKSPNILRSLVSKMNYESQLVTLTSGDSRWTKRL